MGGRVGGRRERRKGRREEGRDVSNVSEVK